MRKHRKAARRMGRARIGRPRKSGERKPSGDLRLAPDEGSPLLLAHRALAIDPTLTTRSADELAKRPEARDRRASYPLGVLLLQRGISSLQHFAGRRYLGLFMAGVRGVGVPSILGRLEQPPRRSPRPNGDVPLDAGAVDINARAEYLAARRLLDRARNGAAQVVDAIVVYEFALIDRLQLAKLRIGLNILARHFGTVEDGDSCG